MDSAEFLDLLGNGNRRRILRLLARKPCYVTEISEQLGVSPKAVIDHLGKLEDAGLIESRTDDRRRKYFSIAQHVSLEVTVSPYEFGTRSAYPSNSRFDITSCRQVSIELESLIAPEERDADTRDDADGGTATDDRAGAGEEHTAEAEPRPRAESGPTAAGPSAVSAPDPESGTDTSSEGADVATLARQLNDFQQLERELSLLHRWAEGRITDLRERLADRVDVADPRLVSELLVALAEEPHQMEQLCRRLGAPPPVVEELLDVLAGEGIVHREGRRWTLVEP
jgi:ArsR family transcriptional regulator